VRGGPIHPEAGPSITRGGPVRPEAGFSSTEAGLSGEESTLASPEARNLTVNPSEARGRGGGMAQAETGPPRDGNHPPRDEIKTPRDEDGPPRDRNGPPRGGLRVRPASAKDARARGSPDTRS